MRCLALADELKARGAYVTFASAAIIPQLAKRIEASGHRLVAIQQVTGLAIEVSNWDFAVLSEEAQLSDARGMIEANSEAPNWIVVDHYWLARAWEEAARGNARILVIDDLANRAHACDLLLDQTLGRTPADYDKLVPAGAEVLAGAAYALLRPDFARERPAALERRKKGGPVERILISLGTTDIGGITARVLDSALAAAPGCVFDVVLGERAPSLERARAVADGDPRVTLHVDTTAMAQLMRDADLAIGAAGTTSWERCCLGLPTLALVLAENQRMISEQLARAGAHWTVEIVERDRLITSLRLLIEDNAARQDMARKAAEVTGGRGTSQVADRLVTAHRGREVA